MGLIEVCPECGFKSLEVRCPRCNTLKVTGCSGSCWACSENSTCAPAETESVNGSSAADTASLFVEEPSESEKS